MIHPKSKTLDSELRNIKFWESVLIPEKLCGFLTPNKKKKLQRFANGEISSGMRFKKLKGFNVYSLRFNDESRALLTPTKINGITTLVILDVFDKHEKYENSKFLKKDILKAFVDPNELALVNNALKFQEIEIPNAFSFVQTQNSANNDDDGLSAVHFDVDNQFITLSNQQNQALEAIGFRLPAVLEGQPGTGKTSIVTSSLTQVSENGEKVLYVTQSQKLLDKIKASVPIGNMENIDFRAYDDLLKEANPEYKIEPSGFEVFRTWLDAYKSRANVKKNPQTTSIFNQYGYDSIYQEFRICSGYQEEEYLTDANTKQSNLENKSEKEWLLEAYKAFIEHLKARKIIISDFTELNPADLPNYDRVFVDESQDFSHLQLTSLARLTRNIGFLVGSGQYINDEIRKTTFLHCYLRELYNNDVCLIQLPISYRCPPAIMQVAAEVNQWRCRLTKKFKSEADIEINESDQRKSFVDLQEKLNERYLKLLDNPRACVISDARFIEELKLLGVSEGQILTPTEAKGLQYETVIAYKPFYGKQFKGINKALQGKGDGKSSYAPTISKAFVTFSRPTESLVVISPNEHNIETLNANIRQVISNVPQEKLATLDSLISAAFTAENWKQEAARLVDNGLETKARQLLIDKVKMNEALAVQFIRDWKNRANALDSAVGFTSTQSEEKKEDLIDTAVSATEISLEEKTINHREPDPKPDIHECESDLKSKLVQTLEALCFEKQSKKQRAKLFKSLERLLPNISPEYLNKIKGDVRHAVHEKIPLKITLEIPFLFLAIENGDKRLVEALVEAGADINSMFGNHVPLEYAILAQQKEIFRFLLKQPQIALDKPNRNFFKWAFSASPNLIGCTVLDISSKNRKIKRIADEFFIAEILKHSKTNSHDRAHLLHIAKLGINPLYGQMKDCITQIEKAEKVEQLTRMLDKVSLDSADKEPSECLRETPCNILYKYCHDFLNNCFAHKQSISEHSTKRKKA